MIVANPVGPPSKKTDTRIRIIIEQLKRIPIEKYACNIAKIHPDTLQRWKNEDPELCLEIEHAKSIGQNPLIEKLGDKDPHKVLKASDYETWKDRTENQLDVKMLVIKKELIGELSEQQLIEYTENELKKLKEGQDVSDSKLNQE